MIISESGLCRNMKEAYRHDGYIIYRHDDMTTIMTGMWMVECETAHLPRKALGLVAEHAGGLPGDMEALRIDKEGEPQRMLLDEAEGRRKAWEDHYSAIYASYTKVEYMGYRILQTEPRPEVYINYGLAPALRALVEPLFKEVAVAPGSVRARACWQSDEEYTERVYVALLSDLPEPDDVRDRRAEIWDILETVDLRPRKASEE